MKKVLIISYAFPPMGGIGVMRTAKMVKYLRLFGWEPQVLTTKNGFSRYNDESLLTEIPQDVKITRINYFDLLNWPLGHFWQSFWQYYGYKYLFYPDREVLWASRALKKAVEIVKKEKIDLIFTSSAAYSNHWIAQLVKAQTGVKWVADFRDEWTNNPELKFANSYHKKRAEELEKEFVNQADFVTTASEPITDYVKSLALYKEKFETVTNGFDPEDFPENPYKPSEFCRLLYAGTLYGGARETAFEEAIKELNLPKLKVEYMGQNGYLPHKEAVRQMQQADALLILLSPKTRQSVYSGKVFEYLAARRPILALTPKGNQLEKLINDLQVGTTVEPLDKEGIKIAITDIYNKWEKNELTVPENDILRFSRKELTGKFVKIFDQAIERTRICLVANTKSPQNEKLTKYLLEQGHEVHFISLDETKIDGAINYQIEQKKLVNKFTPWYLLQGFLNKYKALKELKKLIYEIKPDVVHGHGVNFAGILSYYSGFRPVVVTTRGTDINDLSIKPGFERYLIKETLKKADIVTGSSLALKRQALKLGAPEENWRDVFFGIDMEVFKKKDVADWKSRLGIKDEKVIFCPRTLAPIYNTDILIEALNKIDDKNWKLIFLKYRAEPEYMKKIKEMAESYGFLDKIFWVESATPEDMASLNNLADVTVSLAKSDGAAVSFLEAIACEAKVVISDVEFVSEWQEAKFWTVPVGDVDATKTALVEALSFSKEAFKVDGEKNRQLISDRAEIRSNFHKFEEIYKEIKKV